MKKVGGKVILLAVYVQTEVPDNATDEDIDKALIKAAEDIADSSTWTPTIEEIWDNGNALDSCE